MSGKKLVPFPMRGSRSKGQESPVSADLQWDDPATPDDAFAPPADSSYVDLPLDATSPFPRKESALDGPAWDEADDAGLDSHAADGAFQPEDFRAEAPQAQNLGPENLGSENLGPESFGPESFGPESPGPEQLGAGAPDESASAAASRRPNEEPSLPKSTSGGNTVLPFRRPRNKKMRRLRRSPWVRWLRPLAAALVIVGLPVAFVGWLLSGASFAFTSLEVETPPTGRVAKSWGHKTLAPFGGENLWRLDLVQLEKSLVAHPWIAEVGLRKRPPSTLEVHLVERREAALYRSQAGLVWIDFNGRPIESVDLSRPDPGLDLPILSGSLEAVPAALNLLEEIHEAGQGWSDGLSEIEILGPRDFRVYTTSLPFPLVVRTGSLHEKARHLRALLPRLVERFETIDAVDLRFARRIIIQQPEGLTTPGGQKQRA